MPRFVAPGEPEHEVCLHWKVLFDSQKKKEDDLKREIEEAREAMLKESEKAAKEQESFHMRQGNLNIIRSQFDLTCVCMYSIYIIEFIELNL